MPTAARPPARSRFDADEGIRHDADAAQMAGLRPVFAAGGSVTAGNSSQMSDGAAALVVMAGERAAALGLSPLGRLVSFATAGVDPAIMGIGPVDAVPKALAKAGLSLDDIARDRAQRGVRGAGRRGRARDSAWTRRRRTSTAAPSRSATRSAPPARSSRSSCSPSSRGATHGTGWSPCASAAGRVPPASSSGSAADSRRARDRSGRSKPHDRDGPAHLGRCRVAAS